MKTPRPVFTALNVLGVVVFAVFAWLQREDDNPAIYEDPSMVDVWIWILFYALIAVAFGMALSGKFPVPLYAMIVAFCLFQFAMTGPGLWANITGEEGFAMTKKSMAPDHAYVEQTREFFGAVIALAAILLLFWQRSTQKSSRS